MFHQPVSPTAAALLTRARNSGRCPPSLIGEDRVVRGDEFEAVALRSLENGAGLRLRSDMDAAEGFELAMKMVRDIGSNTGDMNMQQKARVLEMRRCILLAIIGSTPSNSTVLQRILNNGYLVVVKSWLDDILNSSVGGVDLLLHLLGSITMLPVTKEMVTSSKLGKAVAAVEKHKICTGTRNESAIKARVSKVKGEWSASVKKMKQNASSSKRQLELQSSNAGSASKRVKMDDQGAKKGSSFSSLVKKVSGSDNSRTPSSAQSTNTRVSENGIAMSAAEAARLRSQERDAKFKARLQTKEQAVETTLESKVPEENAIPTKKQQKHIKWADNAGGKLLISHELGSSGEAGPGQARKDVAKQGEKLGSVSWTDRRKRDRLREKELLLKARKSKIVDKEDSLDAMAMMVIQWRAPKPLPPDPENPPNQVNSNELAAQVTRMTSVMRANYTSEEEVPKNPAPLSDIEQALDMTSQSSSVPTAIPFYIPQQDTSAVPAPSAPVQPQGVVAPAPAPVNLPPPPPPPPSATSGATLETLQSMGLPAFLVGSNMQAIHTLAASPSLLDTFRDGNGMYDQTRLMALVQTLTMNLSSSQPVQQINQNQAQSMPSSSVPGSAGFQSHASNVPPPPQYGAASSYQTSPQPPTYGGFQSNQGTQGSQSSQNTEGNQGSQRSFSGKGYRGDQNGADGSNLHLSGYGPSTTQAEIIALFSPYVQVEEVVQKNGFSFVNTRDPAGARRAKDALSGALLGGSPVRINIAMRKARDPSYEGKGKGPRGNRGGTSALPRDASGQVALDQVRDDRGNPATKNLFVAGYGNGTTERQLRQIFGQHASVTGCVMKGTFSFVNTSDKMSAIKAREALTGSFLNGGVLRINFAKESGRLGTSFDTTYGPGTQHHNQRYVSSMH